MGRLVLSNQACVIVIPRRVAMTEAVGSGGHLWSQHLCPKEREKSLSIVMRHRLIILEGLEDLENPRGCVDWQHPETLALLPHDQARVRQDPNNLSGRRSTCYLWTTVPENSCKPGATARQEGTERSWIEGCLSIIGRSPRGEPTRL